MNPADLAFVEEAEARIAAVEPLAMLSPSEQREKRLCAIVREQNASIVSLRDKLANETAQRELVEVKRDALQEKLDAIEQSTGELCTICGWAMKFPNALCRCELETERDALRERLAKLEDALGYAVTQLEGANELLFEEDVRGEEDGVGDIRAWIHEIRSTLLKK